MFGCGERTGSLPKNPKSLPENRPFPDFFISTLQRVSFCRFFYEQAWARFIPHYLVARVFRPIPGRTLLKRVFFDSRGKDTRITSVALKGRLAMDILGNASNLLHRTVLSKDGGIWK